MEIINCQQNTEEWYAARRGWTTCSELSTVMAKGEGKTRAKYMRQLAAELILERSASTFVGNVYTEMGKEMEPVGRNLLAIQLDCEITETGIFRDHELGLSCSPDGLIGDDEMAEFKSCIPTVQIERLEKGTLPSEYVAQVQGSLLVTKRKACWFQSFCPGLPRLVLRIEPDLAMHEKIAAEVRAFNKEKHALVEKIQRMQ